MIYDKNAAISEGWVLSERADGIYEIQKHDDDPEQRFQADIWAQEFVKRRASKRSRIHFAAWALHATLVK